MEYTKQALSLMKKYAAKCEIDWENLDSTVFQRHVEARAKDLGLKKITTGIVRWYWLKVHNSIIEKLLSAKRISKKDADYCKTSIRNNGIFHQGMLVEKRKGT